MAEIEAAGGRLVAVSADESTELATLRQSYGLTFPLVSDPDLKIAEAFGVRQKGPDIALPSTFVVGADGVVRFVKVAKHPVDRAPVESILTALRQDASRSGQR